MTEPTEPVYIVFDGPASHESGRFVEVENEAGMYGPNDAKWEPHPTAPGLWRLGPFYPVRQSDDRLREAVAEAIYDAMRENDPEGANRPWVPGGNSIKQDEARRRARAALASDRKSVV